MLTLRFFTVLLLFSPLIHAQENLTFELSGIIKNSETGKVIPNIKITIRPLDTFLQSDSKGEFFVTDLASNRIRFTCEGAGYEFYQSDILVLDRFRKNYIVVNLQPKPIELNEIAVSAQRFEASKPVNELAFVSTRSFSADDTEHIPASVNDPGRMALSFPGVQVGRDENENKIIIRGNSPQGVLWRVEGIDVPNPNHFARPGAAGGGLSIFSAQLLAKSDFSIGGMSAEYGNAIAGAFDIKFREGNLENRQHFIRAGILGIDLSTEGPIKAGRSSYLVNYRYSTLGLMNQIRVYLVGERTLNTFQDLSFNLAFYSKNDHHLTTVFGVGGQSEETAFPVEKPIERNLAFAEDWEERIRASSTGIVGITHKIKLANNSSLKMVIVGIGSAIVRRFDTLNLENARFRYNTEDYIDKRITATIVFDKRISERIKLKTGVIGNFISYDFLRENYPRGNYDVTQLNALKRIFFDGRGNTQTGQFYTNTETVLTAKLRLQLGVHYLHLFLNNKKSFEPRFALKYDLPKGQTVAFSYGLYSQLLPLTTYFTIQPKETGGYQYINPDTDFPQSHHFIGRYQYVSKKQWKAAAEVYYQALRRVQISPSGGNFWMLNYADGFADGPTTGGGTGTNYGIDLMLEKFFVNKFYLLATASVFDATFKTLDAVAYNATFNDNFGISLTTGREFATKRAILQGGFRAMYNGGFRYSPLDEETSRQAGFFNPIVSEFNTLQAPHFYRIDTRIACKFKIKSKPATASLDIQNVTANNNYNRFRYDRINNSIFLERKGVGLVPIFSFGVGL